MSNQKLYSWKAWEQG